ncbi:uncharacterized protein LOC128893378 [Hylaeus anthracinus]|uniref:uncharacterized protein LOC128893378 n=1 Tax=Hylaeus anthracinus TaxID=313031 RepID=UPI0023B8DA47|nr:uncharacterized protein LOC128893378 [Hylaeus anthracinus]
MAPKKCRVRGCTSEGKQLRQFPDMIKDKERCLKWIEACDNPCLLEMNSLKNVKICDIHFEDFYKLNIRLSTSAVPTLHLPKPAAVDASIPAAIPAAIPEGIKATDTMEIVTSQTHSDGHSSRTKPTDQQTDRHQH